MSTKIQWLLWVVATLVLMGYLFYSLLTQHSAAAKTFLPGVTTHGHYQIELKCQECHTPGMGVLHDACSRCHGQELKEATDTHPRSKFTDPGKAHLVKKLDGRSCVTCHQEHVPDRTLAMGLSLPGDYCWHCHQEIGEQRPSHKDLAFDSCATAGCHNYHDNRALFENFLTSHAGEPDVLPQPRVRLRGFAETWRARHADVQALSADDHDAPQSSGFDQSIVNDWVTTAHAAAGVNCSSCHLGDAGDWSDKLTHQACSECHTREVDGMLAGRHGMRLAVGLSPMSPGEARLPMKHDALHKQLDCSACHSDHRFDTSYAAVDACLTCHNDTHSLAYKASSHFDLWAAEQSGDAEPGTGVSCATCHMPRETDIKGQVFVQHNQNNNLRPNDKMIRTVCGSCHGLQFTLDSLADQELIDGNFNGHPGVTVDSINMAQTWAEDRAKLKEEREKRKRRKAEAGDST